MTSNHAVAEPSVIAVDIGGTKMAAAVVDAAGTVGAGATAPTVGDGEQLLSTLFALVDAAVAEASSDPIAIGVGCGGPMSLQDGTVSPLNIPQWRDMALKARLERRYDLPTALDNDAKALALGEGWVGAAVGQRDYLSMVVSTGVGAGIVVDGRLLDGATGNAGHLGHVVVEPLGRRCACGARGCLEAEASGTAIAAITGAPAAEAPLEVRVRTGRLVGRAVANAVNLLDLRLATVAGSVALGYGDVFFDAANDELERLARIEFARGARIVPSSRGAEAPILGAAAVGWTLLQRSDTERRVR